MLTITPPRPNEHTGRIASWLLDHGPASPVLASVTHWPEEGAEVDRWDGRGTQLVGLASVAADF